MLSILIFRRFGCELRLSILNYYNLITSQLFNIVVIQQIKLSFVMVIPD